MKKLSLLVLGMLCLGTSVLAQNPTNLLSTDLISPSPTAVGITRYGDIPVNLFAGTVNISLPLFGV